MRRSLAVQTTQGAQHKQRVLSIVLQPITEGLQLGFSPGKVGRHTVGVGQKPSFRRFW
jgi:hypothetical protein